MNIYLNNVLIDKEIDISIYKQIKIDKYMYKFINK